MTLKVRDLAALCACLALAGCLRITAPDGTTRQPSVLASSSRSLDGLASTREPRTDVPRGLFPLEVGNRWRYTFTSTIIGPDVPGGRTTWLTGDGTMELIGKIRVGPFDFIEARWVTVTTIPATGVRDTFVGSIGYRESFNGLYEAPYLFQKAPSASAIVARAAGVSIPTPFSWPWIERGPLGSLQDAGGPMELKLLSYPLHQGATWTVTEPIHAVVEGVDVLDLPIGRSPAYRVRSFIAGYPNPDDVVIQSWWSRQGLLKERRFLRATCVDPICPSPGTFGETVQTIQEIHLRGPA